MSNNESNGNNGQGRQRSLGLRVAKKGGVSVYGLQKLPVTLYAQQWERVFDREDDILNFIRSNRDLLDWK